jgi:hypothetical protein
MKIVNSENGHLWYVVDEENKIIYLSISKENCEKYLLRRER